MTSESRRCRMQEWLQSLLYSLINGCFRGNVVNGCSGVGTCRRSTADDGVETRSVLYRWII